MGHEPSRTDYLPEQVYVNNANWTSLHPAAHPAVYKQRLPSITVPFESDFDKFAAHVAYAIRRHVIYRSDGGAFARGLVRKQLEPIHWYLLRKAKAVDGQPVRLEAQLWRRKDPVNTRNWAMQLLLALSAGIVDGDNEVSTVSQTVIGDNERHLRETVLHTAALVAQKIDRQNRNQGKRIHGMLDIASRLGYPKFLDLWYYGPAHVAAYMDNQTTDRTRKLMTAKTNGRFPFDGWPMQGEGQSWDTHEWRSYPFKNMIKLCRRALDDPDRCEAYINNVLLIAHRDIYASLQIANQTYQFSQSSSALHLGDLWASFFLHLSETQHSADHLLSVFAKDT